MILFRHHSVAMFLLILTLPSTCQAEWHSSLEDLPVASRKVAIAWQLPREDQVGIIRDPTWLISSHSRTRNGHKGRVVKLQVGLAGTWSYESVWRYYAEKLGADATYPSPTTRQRARNTDGVAYSVFETIEKRRRYTEFVTSTTTHKVSILLCEDATLKPPADRVLLMIYLIPK